MNTCKLIFHKPPPTKKNSEKEILCIFSPMCYIFFIPSSLSPFHFYSCFSPFFLFYGSSLSLSIFVSLTPFPHRLNFKVPGTNALLSFFTARCDPMDKLVSFLNLNWISIVAFSQDRQVGFHPTYLPFSPSRLCALAQCSLLEW